MSRQQGDNVALGVDLGQLSRDKGSVNPNFQTQLTGISDAGLNSDTSPEVLAALKFLASAARGEQPLDSVTQQPIQQEDVATFLSQMGANITGPPGDFGEERPGRNMEFILEILKGLVQ
jgi:hypothetical protein